MSVFSELFLSEVFSQNPKYKLKDVTKKLNPRDFIKVKNETEEKEEEERRKEARHATPEEIAEEMKVPVADRVTPYHMFTYQQQIEKKREQMHVYLEQFSSQLENDVKQGREEGYPGWYTQEMKDAKKPCALSHIIECEEEHRDQYRNKVEFTIGRTYKDNAICVGFNTGNPSKGITFVDYPDGIKTNSVESVLVAKKVQDLVIASGIEPYDRRVNLGFWRLLLYRESKRTNQVLISVIVTGDNFIVEPEKQQWIED
jgi:tRNA/tmRNA/rRNA uracil-C5-methylase (TrmA/RlmC/RlmD family)